MADDRRFCPLHGEYVASGPSARCPDCAKDPMGSSASLRQVRVVPEDILDPEGQPSGETTPLKELFPCPVCGSMTELAQFRVETSGEVWSGQAAVWAEEGVCPACYHDVLAEHVREWTSSEWLVHHYEGWKATVEKVHTIFEYETSPAEAWLPDDEQHRILDVEKTLSARREHLARCQITMRELQSRYDAKITPPPFQMTLASGSAGVDSEAVAELQRTRERDLKADMMRREHSVLEVGPLGAMADTEVPLSNEPPASRSPDLARAATLRFALLLAALGAIVAGLALALKYL